MKLRRILPLLSLLAPAVCNAQSHTLGINFAGDVYKISLTNGTGVLLGSSGLSGTNCMARETDFWMTIDDTAKLCRINPVSGAASLIFQLDLGGNTDVRGFAADVNRKYYVVVNKAVSDELWTFSPTTGVGTLIGTMNSISIQGLAVGFNGRLYAYDTSLTNSGGLREVNPLTGATVDLDPLSPGQSGIQDIFPEGGGLSGGRDSLYGLTATGSEFLIGTGGYSDVRGFGRRQSTLQVDSMSVKLGKQDSGNFNSVQRRDGDEVVVSKFFVPNQIVDPINVEATFGTPIASAEITDLGVYWVGRMLIAGSFVISIDILNLSTNTFDHVTATQVTTALTEISGAKAGSLVNYFNGNKRVVLRYRVKAIGPTASPSWAVATDMFRCEQIATY